MTIASEKRSTGALSWRDAFPGLDAEDKGIILRGARMKEGLTQAELARRTGIPQRHLSEMETNKRAIGKQRAKILADALNIGYKVFVIIHRQGNTMTDTQEELNNLRSQSVTSKHGGIYQKAMGLKKFLDKR